VSEAPPVGIWEVKATLPDGSLRPSVLTVSENDGHLSLAAGELGERKFDRITQRRVVSTETPLKNSGVDPLRGSR
jgi:hypothetical protein